MLVLLLEGTQSALTFPLQYLIIERIGHLGSGASQVFFIVDQQYGFTFFFYGMILIIMQCNS